MTSYAVFETLIVVLIAVFSAYQVMKMLMPQAAQKLGGVFSMRLNGGQGKRPLAKDLPDAGSGCGLGCGSGCNGCGAATGNHQSLAGRQETSR